MPSHCILARGKCPSAPSQLLQSGMHGGEWVTPPETAKGTLAIVGIGFAHAQPLSFQLVDCTADPKEEISLFLGRDMMSCVSVSEVGPLTCTCWPPQVANRVSISFAQKTQENTNTHKKPD